MPLVPKAAILVRPERTCPAGASGAAHAAKGWPRVRYWPITFTRAYLTKAEMPIDRTALSALTAFQRPSLALIARTGLVISAFVLFGLTKKSVLLTGI